MVSLKSAYVIWNEWRDNRIRTRDLCRDSNLQEHVPNAAQVAQDIAFLWVGNYDYEEQRIP
jgi:hypothetical protein